MNKIFIFKKIHNITKKKCILYFKEFWDPQKVCIVMIYADIEIGL